MADATPLWETTVYGPVRSRRLGTSLGVNLTPLRSKLCSFDCPYCQCGFNTTKADGARWPSPDEVAHSLSRALARAAAPPDWITFSGNGEPTLHPRFAVVVDRVLVVRADVASQIRVGILSNGIAADRPAVRAAPDAVQLYSLARPPADPTLQNVPRERLEEMAVAIRSALPRCSVAVF